MTGRAAAALIAAAAYRELVVDADIVARALTTRRAVLREATRRGLTLTRVGRPTLLPAAQVIAAFPAIRMTA